MYYLRRVSDGAGDSGAMSIAWDPVAGKVVGDRPVVGAHMRVGSHFARTFGSDFWTTTPVTEILEDRETYVRFKTRNSEYEWRTT